MKPFITSPKSTSAVLSALQFVAHRLHFMTALIAFLVFGGLYVAPVLAGANPTTDRAESIITEIDLGQSSFRLTTDRPAIPTNGSYLYTVEIAPGDDLISVNLHFQLMREENGWAFHYFADSVYIDRPQTDESDNEGDEDSNGPTLPNEAAEAEVIRHELRRRSADNLDGLGMREGVYYVAVIVTTTTAAGVESATLQDILVVYEPDHEQLEVMPVVQLGALPSRDARGNFWTNPNSGIFEERRAALELLCDWINANPRAFLTLALSPLFLDELSAVATGYSYHREINGGSANGGGNDNGDSNSNDSDESYRADIDVDIATNGSDSPTAQRSVRTLAALQSAHATGRLTVTTQSYADPDFTILDTLDLGDDLKVHFDLGSAVLARELGTEPAAITVPWSSQISSQQIDASAEFISSDDRARPQIIIDSNARGFDSKPRLEDELPTIFYDSPVRNSEIILADANLSAMMSTADKSRASYIVELLNARHAHNLLPVLVRTHDDMSQVDTLLANLELLASYDWIRLKSGEVDNGTAPDTRREIMEFVSYETPQDIPVSIGELQTARQAILGLALALDEPDDEQSAEIDQYTRASLAAFAGPGMNLSQINRSLHISAAAEQCLIVAEQVQAHVDSWLEDVSINAHAITFSGSSGSLPITVLNNSTQPLNLEVRYISPGQNIIVQPEYESQQFLIGESFLEPTVELRNIVSGSVDIQVWAGDYMITKESVRVSATYADRIAIIVVVALAGTGLAFFVWRRVSIQNQNGNSDNNVSGESTNKEPKAHA